MKYSIRSITCAALCSVWALAPAAFVINEADTDTPGADKLEFIELKGNPNESADGFSLVFFNGDATGGPASYKAVSLDGATADANGYLLVASNPEWNPQVVMPDGFLQNGEDGIALYQASASAFPNGTRPTPVNLVDLLVYKTAATQKSNDWSEFGVPVTVYDEGAVGGVTLFSLARIPEGTGPFMPAEPTPSAPNAQKLTYTLTTPFLVPRYNQSTAVVPTSLLFTVRNTGSVPLTVNSFELLTTSSAAFTTALPADPAPPVTLLYNQTTTMTIQFLETDLSANKSYAGAVKVTTDNPATPEIESSFQTELVRSTTSAAPGAVMVNEICYNPGSVDHNNDGSTASQGDEFVELINMTNAPILIEGWEQRCTDNDSPTFHSFVFPAGATIPANGFVTVFTSGDPTGFAPGTTFTYGIPRIRNSGAFVNITDGVNQLDGVAFDKAQTTPPAPGYVNAEVVAVAGGSIGRRPDGSSTFVAFSPTATDPNDYPSPNASNNGVSAVAEWMLF